MLGRGTPGRSLPPKSLRKTLELSTKPLMSPPGSDISFRKVRNRHFAVMVLARISL